MSKKVSKSKKGSSKTKNSSRYYISNDILIDELKIVYETGVFTPQMGEYVNQIVEGISKSSNFVNYSWLNEMKSDAIYRVCKAITDKGFKIIPESEIGKPKKDKNGNQVYSKGTIKTDEKGNTVYDEEGNPVYNMDNPVKITQNNAFGYFSMIAWHAFQNRIKTEKKHENAIEAYRDKVFEDFELEYGIKLEEHNEESDY